MSMIIDGTNGLTFNNATTQNSGGKVLQVVQAITTSGTSTTSTSFVTTGFSTSITPLFSTSKILVTINGQSYSGSTNTNYFTVYRASTNLTSATSGFALGQNSATGVWNFCINYLDSPTTTSSTTYTLYFKTSSGTGYFIDNSVATITLMEISA